MEVREVPARPLDIETGAKRLREAVAVHSAGHLKRALKLDDKLLGEVDGWLQAAAMFEKGRVLDDLGRGQEAVRLWRDVTQLQIAHVPGDGGEASLALSARYAIARYELGQHEPAEALQLQLILIDQLSDDDHAAEHFALARLAVKLAQLLIGSGRDEQALDLLAVAIDAIGESDTFEVRKVDAHLRLVSALAFGRLGRTQESGAMTDALVSGGEPALAMIREWTETGRARSPGPYDAEIGLGLMLEAEILVKTGHRDEALTLIRAAIDELGDNTAPGVQELVGQARAMRDEIARS